VICSVRVRVAHPGTHPVEAIFKHLPESIETIGELFGFDRTPRPLLKLAAVFGFKGFELFGVREVGRGLKSWHDPKDAFRDRD
jgi:hypothetical protein